MSNYDLLEAFFAEARKRMAKGATEYGERSWSKDPDVLLSEAMEELSDAASWAGITWCRLYRLREVLREIKAEQRK